MPHGHLVNSSVVWFLYWVLLIRHFIFCSHSQLHFNTFTFQNTLGGFYRETTITQPCQPEPLRGTYSECDYVMRCCDDRDPVSGVHRTDTCCITVSEAAEQMEKSLFGYFALNLSNGFSNQNNLPSQSFRQVEEASTRHQRALNKNKPLNKCLSLCRICFGSSKERRRVD